ncbi:MAG: substrate-binding domain-containing protein [Anaerolineae bacterium]|nr:substrate-binding domain-containing protein [Anaerolineae bacterium]MCB0222580.1 substrate-binding domain-containing protein [Anaerolineae bacterium]MCB9106516.1 substrate-binding domain-containing protein [Anaerolineales bacterium]
MLSRNSLKIVGLLLVSIILGLLAAACGAQPAAPQTIIQTVEVEKVVEKVVEVVETVEVEKVVEKEVEKIVTVEVMKDGEATEAMSSDDNPYRPSDLFAAVEDIKAATEGKSPPAGAKFAFLTNNMSPFWTAAQIGVARSSSELNVPVSFQAPTSSDLLSQQLSMLETFVNDGYTGVTFSAIDREAPHSIIEKAVEQGTIMLNMDSDATGSDRAMYIGMSDYDAGRAAAEAALEIIGEGQVVGLVGFATAQNAQDRIAGVNDVFEGTDMELVEVLIDDVKPEVALSNAQTAIQKYGDDLAGFITFYSYDGPAACQAIKQADKVGELKLIAFDAEPETQTCMEEGVAQAMIGQRVYFYGYLSGYVMNAMSILGVEETMAVLDPYLDDLGDEGKIRLNTGIDVIKADTFDQYKAYLESIGIASQ